LHLLGLTKVFAGLLGWFLALTGLDRGLLASLPGKFLQAFFSEFLGKLFFGFLEVSWSCLALQMDFCWASWMFPC
jgi:hypothetical protein